jgi:hypothetical protein
MTDDEFDFRTNEEYDRHVDDWKDYDDDFDVFRDFDDFDDEYYREVASAEAQWMDEEFPETD